MPYNNLAKGTSVKQRADWLQKYYTQRQPQNYNSQDLLYYKRWRQRPTLVTDERFEEMLETMGLTKATFDLAIKELTAAEKDYLLLQVSTESWLQTTQAIFQQPEDSSGENNSVDTTNFTYAIRLHLAYFEAQLTELLASFPTVQIKSTAFVEYVAEVINRLMDIGLKTFVYDLHDQKEQLDPILDEKQQFQQYLQIRFEKLADLKEFYYDFPVLTRLYAETIQFQLNNLRQLLQALTESKKELRQTFGLNSFVVTGIKMGAGDSHDQGKTVAILTFEEGPELVYKPKNLKVAQQFDRFVQGIKQLDKRFDFYLIKKVVKDAYTFEERLHYLSCQTKEEINAYYRQFGQLIALVYLLNGNDFHLENVLSHGKYPVLIDLETIIQNHFPMPDADNALMKVAAKNNESVIMSGLVPIYLFEERAEDDVETPAKGVQLSALSGDRQKLPYKVLKLINYDSVNMQFLYQEHFTEGSENIPMLHGEKVDFGPYIDEIIAGFREFCSFARRHQEQLVELAEELFANVLVRNVIKTTQSYGDLLDYSTHPACMVDYIEREKLFENLWMHSYANAKPVPYEIRDMLQHDVPIFFQPTGTKNLVASQGEIIHHMYQQTAFYLVLERLKNFSKEEEQEQLDYLKTSFGLYHPMDLQKQTASVEPTGAATWQEYALAVGDKILRASFVGTDSIAWKDVEGTSPKNYIVSVMNENLYDGIAGMYLCLSELYHVTGEERFKPAYQLAEALIIKLKEDYVDSISAFYGSFAAVYPLLYTYGQTKEAHLLAAAETIAHKFMDQYAAEKVKSYDWTGGIASIVKVFTLLYQVTGQSTYWDFARGLFLDIELETVDQAGFAHGFAGIIACGNSLLKRQADSAISARIKQCLAKERLFFDSSANGWLDVRPEIPVVNDLWCYGSTGIGLVYLDLLKSGFKDKHLKKEVKLAANRLLATMKTDDCLCHGNFGDLEFLRQFAVSGFANTREKRAVNQKIQQLKEKIGSGTYLVEGLATIPKYGLFTGLAGISHGLLRLTDSAKTADVLSLELPKLQGVER